MPELKLSHLTVQAGTRRLVDDISLSLASGEILGMVGASGSGKTVTARALLGLVDADPGVVRGELDLDRGAGPERIFEGAMDQDALDQAFAGLRGTWLGLLHQDARGALDPLFRVGTQVRWAAQDQKVDPWLLKAGLPNPERVRRLYPHQLSGGMAQRVQLAQFLARGSRFLVADEPTTGLDPTVQQEILAELKQLATEGVGVLLITHDLRILPGLADRIVILHEGKLIERTRSTWMFEGLTSSAGQALVRATLRIAGKE